MSTFHVLLQELVINARLTEKYGEDFGISLPDEHHIRCAKFETIHTSESALDRCKFISVCSFSR